ncbi:MAG: hypothetical protein HOQ01_01850 [Lysobacter sp.]|nr:hypothetical protein [Lysobacter sp.]
MSLQKQVTRGLYALPVATLLILVGAIAPAERGTPQPDGLTKQVIVVAQADARTVDFHSMLPGALHVLRKAPAVVVHISEG